MTPLTPLPSAPRASHDELEARLVDLCAAADRRASGETSDSWLINCRPPELIAVRAAVEADPAVQALWKRDRFLFILGAGGNGYAADLWVASFLRDVSRRPATEWEQHARRFAAVLRLVGGVAPCEVRATLPGVVLANGEPLELSDGRLRPAVGTDFFNWDGGKPPAGVVYEYERDLPATAGSLRFSWPADELADLQLEHDRHVTRLLLALIFTVDGPVQEHLVMRAPLYLNAGWGEAPEPVGPVQAPTLSHLDAGRCRELQDTFSQLADVDTADVAVATRRYLLAATERVRPADRVIDYAIALESMTSVQGGAAQGDELVTLLARGDQHTAGLIEQRHRRFRRVRQLIVHEGHTPPDVDEVAGIGRQLLRESLRARVGLPPRSRAAA